MGASDVIVTDIDDARLALAKKMGATKTLRVESQDPAAVAQQVREVLGAMPDCAVEASGAQFSVQMGIRALKPGSAFAVVGHGPDDIQIPIVQAIAREIDIRGTFQIHEHDEKRFVKVSNTVLGNNYVHQWPTAVEMLAAGSIDVKPMITHYFTLEETLKAFETAKSGQGVKIIIDCEKKQG
nr:hypothetical protein BaRGS_009349 [Batillaria attramentaria]